MKRSLSMVVWAVGLAVTVGAQTPGRLPWLATDEGKPIDTRPTEKKDNTPAFPEQTRAPFHATAPFKVTTLINNLEVSWSLAFLPSGNIIFTERLPGTDADSPHRRQGVGAAGRRVGGRCRPARKTSACSMSCSIPTSRTTRRIFFSFFNYIDNTNTQHVHRAGAPRRERARADRRRGDFPRAAGHAVETSRRQDGRPHRDRPGRQSVHDHSAIDRIRRRGTSRRSWTTISARSSASRPTARRRRTIRSSASRACCPRSGRTACAARKGLTFDPRTGRLWQNDHGPRGGDELNIIEKGKNYGWPVVVHGIDYPGTADRRRHHAQGRHGGAGLLLGSGHRAVRPRVLHRQSVSAMEEQPLRRRPARRDARPARDRRTTRSWRKSRC